jgi:calcium/calmodulin-dependent protein kinase I
LRTSLRRMSLTGSGGGKKREKKGGDEGSSNAKGGGDAKGSETKKEHEHNHEDGSKHSLNCPKHEEFLVKTFGTALAGQKLIADFSCYYDSDRLRPAHMFCTEKYLCFHILSDRSQSRSRSASFKHEDHECEAFCFPWAAVCDIRKKNTARLVPNAIEVETSSAVTPHGEEVVVAPLQSRKFFFAFLNRHTCFKMLHKMWVGYDHKSGCTHEHTHEHPQSARMIDDGEDDGDDDDGSAEAKERHSSDGAYNTGTPKMALRDGDTEESGYFATAGDPETPSTTRRRLRRPSVADVEENVLEAEKTVPIEDEFEFGDQIGRGAFSTVHLVTARTSQEKCAVKVINKAKVAADKKEMLEREVDIIKRIQHPNIIAVKRIFETDTTLYLVMELAHGGELFEEIVKRGKYSERDAASIIKQVASAIHYLHTKGIVHRDLKPENLLLSKPQKANDDSVPVVKIADFGLSKIMDAQGVMKTACGTPAYVAPEILLGEGYDQKVDVWSLGVIAYILLCGFPPFYSRTGNNAELFERIMGGEYRFLKVRPGPCFLGGCCFCPMLTFAPHCFPGVCAAVLGSHL